VRPLLCGLLLAAGASLAFGQLDSNSITVTASSSTTIQADEAVFLVSVTSSLDTKLDQVVAAIAQTGITGSDLVSVNIIVFPSFAAPSVMGLQWTFLLGAPLSKIKDTSAALSALAQTISENGSGLTLKFQFQGTRVSAQAQAARQCPVSDLLADATTQAKKLADAAQFSAGPILAISEAQVLPAAQTVSAISVPLAVGTGSGTLSGFLVSSVPVGTTSNVAAGCSLTVKFALYHYH